MEKQLLFLIFFTFSMLAAAQKITGRVLADGSVPVAAVLVINISTDEKTYTDSEGGFAISASIGNEIRFVKQGYERKSVFVNSSTSEISIDLNTEVREIEEVEVNPVKLSGDLRKDSKSLTKIDRMEQVRQEIGVPAPPEKPRETAPPTVKDVGVAAFVLNNLNLNNLYKNISGDARRMRQLYKFEDRQDDINWILNKFGSEYFTEQGVPAEKISMFIEFAMVKDPQIEKFIKAKNASAVSLRLDALIPDFKTLNSKK